MKCVSCKEGEMVMSIYKRTKYKYSSATKEHAVLVCNKCGHKEVF